MKFRRIPIGALRYLAPALLGAVVIVAGAAPAAELPKSVLEGIPAALPGAEALPKDMHSAGSKMASRDTDASPKVRGSRSPRPSLSASAMSDALMAPVAFPAPLNASLSPQQGKELEASQAIPSEPSSQVIRNN